MFDPQTVLSISQYKVCHIHVSSLHLISMEFLTVIYELQLALTNLNFISTLPFFLHYYICVGHTRHLSKRKEL